MNRDPLVLLDYETKRRPELAQLASQIDDLSEADIRASPVGLPWMREALVTLKAKRRKDALEAAVGEWATHGYASDPDGVMRVWTAPEGYLRIGRTELLMKPGQLIWLDRTGLWIDTIFTTYVDASLLRNTAFKARMRRSAYYEAVRAARSTAVVSETNPEKAFRIYRP